MIVDYRGTQLHPTKDESEKSSGIMKITQINAALVATWKDHSPTPASSYQLNLLCQITRSSDFLKKSDSRFHVKSIPQM